MFGDNMDHGLFLSLQEGCCDETQICGTRSSVVAILATFLYKNPFYAIIARLTGLVYQTKDFLFKLSSHPRVIYLYYFASWCDQTLDTKQPK